MADEVADQKPSNPRVSEFNPVVEILTHMYDLLQLLNANTVAAAGGKPGKLRPLPRPETAAQRLKRRQEYSAFRDIVAQVAPHELDRFD